VADRLTEIETQLAFQDDVISQLNSVVTAQQRQLDQLQMEVRLLREQLTAMRDKLLSSVTEPPPPHY
jgi:SlyX protein